MKLQLITFELGPFGRHAMVPTFFPLVVAVLEVILRKCFQFVGYIFLDILYSPIMMTLQCRFQFGGDKNHRGLGRGCREVVEVWGFVFWTKTLELTARYAMARYH